MHLDLEKKNCLMQQQASAEWSTQVSDNVQDTPRTTGRTWLFDASTKLELSTKLI